MLEILGTIGTGAVAIVALLALVVLIGQRLSASRAKKAGNKVLSRRFRRHSWISLAILIVTLLGLLWIYHPAIIFDHIGL